MLFSNQRVHQIEIPATDKSGGPVSIAFLIHHLCDNVMKDTRKEMFLLDDHVYGFSNFTRLLVFPLFYSKLFHLDSVLPPRVPRHLLPSSLVWGISTGFLQTFWNMAVLPMSLLSHARARPRALLPARPLSLPDSPLTQPPVDLASSSLSMTRTGSSRARSRTSSSPTTPSSSCRRCTAAKWLLWPPFRTHPTPSQSQRSRDIAVAVPLEKPPSLLLA